jgi:hypothetical protein
MTKDLIALVPDKNIKFGIKGLLSRPQSLNIRALSHENYDIYIHPFRDPGVYHDAPNFLRQFSREYSYALVLLDHEGSGQEETLPGDLANRLRQSVERNGWPGRVEVIIFDPEFEIWVWADSPHVSTALGWDSFGQLRDWLVAQGVWQRGYSKPQKPKRAVEMALKEKRVQRSSSIYLEIAQNVSLRRCRAQSFQDFKNILQRWFPRSDS